MTQAKLFCKAGKPDYLQLQLCPTPPASLFQNAKLFFGSTPQSPVQVAQYHEPNNPDNMQLVNGCLIYNVPASKFSSQPERAEYYAVYEIDRRIESSWMTDHPKWHQPLQCQPATATDGTAIPVTAIDPIVNATSHVIHRHSWIPFKKHLTHDVEVAMLIGLILGVLFFLCSFTCVACCMHYVHKRQRRKRVEQERRDYERLTTNPPEENEFMLPKTASRPPKAGFAMAKPPVKRASITQSFLDRYYFPHMKKINEDDKVEEVLDDVQF